tara:strand:+ start:63 stop:596 length:534 start_codon:yes stop_codon:yes gene_type:complete
MIEELLRMLKESAYRKGEFKLSSGKTSEHYVNCKPVILNGKGLFYTSCLLLEQVDEGSVAVGGLTLGADPLVSGVAMAAALDEVSLNALIVRKEQKGHGTNAWIEGPLPVKGTKIDVLEDVVTTGGSALFAVQKLRDAGYVVDRIICIVNRMDPDFQPAMDAAGVELRSLFTLEEII